MNEDFKRLLSERFGMFVHYGAYSVLGGKYRGEEIPGLGEWIQLRARIPNAEYERVAREEFRPAPDFAERLVKSAKAAGVRYIVLTAKHHDGFCLFKTAADGYNTYDYFGRDLCRELADACRAEGMALGFYYSHTLDWHERNAGGNHALSGHGYIAKNRNDWDFPDPEINFSQYFRDKCLPQVRELLTNYGELKLIWFDFPHDITDEESAELRATVKALQPHCLINSRIGHNCCDYYSLGDNVLPAMSHDVPTECLVTLNDTWGYKSYDHNWKSPESVIGILCRTLACDATLLLNVGPMASGALTPETEAILAELGRFTERNGEAIYGGVTGNPFPTSFPWGYAAAKGNCLYLYLKEAPEELRLSGIPASPLGVRLLGAEEATPFTFSDGVLSFRPRAEGLTLPVYAVELPCEARMASELTVDSTRAALPVSLASVARREDPHGALCPIRYEFDIFSPIYAKRGLSVGRLENTHGWLSPEEMLAFDVTFAEVGEYAAEVVCTAAGGETRCTAPDTEAPYALAVGEECHPLEPGIAESYRISLTGSFNVRHVRRAGLFRIDAPGRYRVILRKESDELGIGVTELRFKKQGESQTT